MRIQPVIMSGGSGTRLWPLSRFRKPKQFLSLMNHESLLQNTMMRVADTAYFDSMSIISNQAHFSLIRDQMLDLDIQYNKMILEPIGRNTAAAVIMAALTADTLDTVQLILPADHYISDEGGFITLVRKGLEVTSEYIVTFGVVPTAAETGYGYIQAGEEMDHSGIYKIDSFKEKPNQETADAWFKQGGYSWNSGMFMFKACILLEEAHCHCPEVLQACQKALSEAVIKDKKMMTFPMESFTQIPSKSIDIAVMEKTKRGVVIPADIGWSDVGSWSSLYASRVKDYAGNVVQGDVILENSVGNFVHATNRLVVLADVEGLAVIETADAILILPRENTESVKNIVNQLKSSGRKEVNDIMDTE